MEEMNENVASQNGGENTKEQEITEVTRMGSTNGSGGNGKRLVKSKNKMLCGVCAGIAEYFGIDATVVRLIVVFLSLAGVGSGILAYIIAAIVMPDAPAAE